MTEKEKKRLYIIGGVIVIIILLLMLGRGVKNTIVNEGDFALGDYAPGDFNFGATRTPIVINRIGEPMNMGAIGSCGMDCASSAQRAIVPASRGYEIVFNAAQAPPNISIVQTVAQQKPCGPCQVVGPPGTTQICPDGVRITVKPGMSAASHHMGECFKPRAVQG